MKKALFIFICFVQITYTSPVACEEKAYLTIGTGDITGLYYLTGGAIARIVNSKSKETGLRLNAQSTSGSVYNIDNVLTGSIELAIVQSDRLYQAYNGTLKWNNNPQKQLRTIFGIHPEAVTLIASEDSGIACIGDLKNKRVNLGHLDSGQRQNALHALENEGFQWRNDLKAFAYEDYKVPEMIHSNQLDAAFITAGHPTDFFNAICSGKKIVQFIPILNVDPILKKYPYYIHTSIPLTLYPSFSAQSIIPSFGVKSILMTSEKINERLIYIITKEIFTQIKQLKKFHPAYSVLTPQYMIEGLTAPIHPGALKYFKEAKLLTGE
ncbi:MAG: TAXI family TRAP transporter solute-binding subunit [Candidatus Magnetomorum sp.]|nr:TAXI family TRAP transporter solute-binding subunit [Candidatus Magnetomorum sp.]